MSRIIKINDIVWHPSIYSKSYFFGHLKGDTPLTKEEIELASDKCHNHFSPNIGRDYFYRFIGSEHNESKFCKVVFNDKDIFGPSKEIEFKTLKIKGEYHTGIFLD